MKAWRGLRKKMPIRENAAYWHNPGNPLLPVWETGFSNARKYTLEECRRLIEFLKHDPEAGGCTVMVGVPAHWRELNRDAISDPKLLEVLKLADVISPWTVGRYTSLDGARDYAEKQLKPDLDCCRQ